MKVTIWHVKAEHLADFYSRKSQAEVAYRLLMVDAYQVIATIEIEDQPGRSIEDELFDLTNNPSRHEEKIEKLGKCRSLSVGDIVEYNGNKLVCCSVGWEIIEE